MKNNKSIIDQIKNVMKDVGFNNLRPDRIILTDGGHDIITLQEFCEKLCDKIIEDGN